MQVKQAQLAKKYHNKRIRIHNLTSFKKSDWLIFFETIRYKKAKKKFCAKYFSSFIVEKVKKNFTYYTKKLEV